MKFHHLSGNPAPFFEGWYFKNQNADNTVAFIPGVSITGDGERTAFIQVITDGFSYTANYDFEDFYASKDRLFVRIAGNTFSDEGISVNITSDGMKCIGKLKYTDITPIKYDIMGPFSLLGNMECNHGILSMHHLVHGNMEINGEKWSFAHDTGYIEKDWGRSFPSSYTWLQCNSFDGLPSDRPCSIMLSIADIPLGGLTFKGFIANVLYEGRQFRMATYNGAKVIRQEPHDIRIKKGKFELRAEIPQNAGHPLKAPSAGGMTRTIHETPSCAAHFEFKCKGAPLFEADSRHASYEISNEAH